MYTEVQDGDAYTKMVTSQRKEYRWQDWWPQMVRQLTKKHKHRGRVWNFHRNIPEMTILYKNSFSIFQLHIFSSLCPWIYLETLTPKCFLELSATCFDFCVSDFIMFFTHHFLWVRFWHALSAMNWCATGVL